MGYDPKNNDIDRRIHYEVTGVSLVEGEFADDDSSDEEWERQQASDPLRNAFSYNQVVDSEEEGGDTSVALIGGGDEESREDKSDDGKSPSSVSGLSINNWASLLYKFLWKIRLVVMVSYQRRPVKN